MNKVNINRDLSFDVINNFGIKLNRKSTNQSFELIEEELILLAQKILATYNYNLDEKVANLVKKLQ